MADRAGLDGKNGHGAGVREPKKAMSKPVGSVYVFGSGDCCQLGLGEDILSRKKPTKIDYFDDKLIVDVAAGGLHNLALGATGIVYSWGCNDEKALGHEAPEWAIAKVDALAHEKIVQITCGDSISAALTEKGAVYAWGTFRDSKGVMGFDSKTLLQSKPTLIESLSSERVVGIAAGANHLLALTDKGQLFTWGSGEQGQLGRRIIERRKTTALGPKNVTPRAKPNFCSIACGSYHSMAWSNNDGAYAWGLNNYGQLGHGDKMDRILPERIAKILHLKDMDAGEHHSVGLDLSGHVYSWGRGDSGQLGIVNDGKCSDYIDQPSLVSGFDAPVAMIASGSNHCLAVDQRGQLYSWGFGGMYQLGNGKEEDELKPFKIDFKAGKITKVQAGGQHSMILCQH